MASTPETVNYLCDQMSAAGEISARRMFGEYGVYCEGKFIGVICDNILFLKETVAGRAFAPGLELVPAYEGAKPGLCLTAEHVEDRDRLVALVRLTHDNLPAVKKKKAGRS